MSTLIERMILRTQAPLSSLEPIAPVRFAPTTSAQPPDETTVTDLQSAPAKVTTQGFPPPTRRSSRQNGSRRDGIGSASLLPPITSPGSITDADAEPSVVRRDRRTASGGPGSVLDQEDLRDSNRSAVSVGADGGEPGLRDTTASDQTGPRQPITVTARLQPPDLAGSSGAAVQPPIVDAASDEGSRGPDITVTIGHIEVRAAQAPPASPAKPARPPFRPQVSLADFLNGSTKGSRR